MSTISIYILVTELVGDVANVSTLEIVRVTMKKLLGIAAVAVVAVMVADPAFATPGGGTQMKDMLSGTQANLAGVPSFINWVSYIIGVALGVAGVSKLKAHVDNPGQNSIKDGLGRLAASGMFISLPFVLEVIRNTQNVGTDQANIIQFGGDLDTAGDYNQSY